MGSYKFCKDKKNGEIVVFTSDKSINYELFEEVSANTVDAAFEKHVPVYEIDDDFMTVSVGEVSHPMDDDHYIMWIAVICGDNLEMVKLKPGDEPKATFKYAKGAEIYAYCNLHGLWAVKK